MDGHRDGIRALKDALSRVGMLAHATSRSLLVVELHHSGILVDPNLEGGRKMAASSLVDECVEFPGGLFALADAVAFFESGSNRGRAVSEAVGSLLPSRWLRTIGERVELVRLLAGRLDAGRLDACYQSVTGYTPRFALRDVDALVRAIEVVPVGSTAHPLLQLTVRAAAGAPEETRGALLAWSERLAERMAQSELLADLQQHRPTPLMQDEGRTEAVPGMIAESDTPNGDGSRSDAGRRPRSMTTQRHPRPTGNAVDGRAGAHVVAVGTEWGSSHGGISTFNRRLCCVLASLGVEVSCVVAQVLPRDRADAEAARVTLLDGAPENAPDIVIGHGRVTGEAASEMAARFPSARYVHFFHMASDETELQKPDRPGDATERANERRLAELRFAQTADVAVAVGPRLYDRFRAELNAYPEVRLIRFDPGFDSDDPVRRAPPQGRPWRVLLLGRAEDAELKGLDIAVKAVADAAIRRGQVVTPIEFVVRGAPPGSGERLRRRLREWAGLPRLSIVVRPYSADPKELTADLLNASVAVMPSRAEGFGLAGVEAIVAGTPLLVAADTGLGQLLGELLDPEDADRFIVPVSHDLEVDAHRWGADIWAVLRDRKASFERADELRRLLAARKTWEDSARGFLGALGFLVWDA